MISPLNKVSFDMNEEQSKISKVELSFKLDTRLFFPYSITWIDLNLLHFCTDKYGLYTIISEK